MNLAEVVDRDDVQRVEPAGELGLTAESGLKSHIAGQVGGQAFESDDPLAGGVVGAVDLAHAAAPDQRVESVGAEQFGHAGSRLVRAGTPRRPTPLQNRTKA